MSEQGQTKGADLNLDAFNFLLDSPETTEVNLENTEQVVEEETLEETDIEESSEAISFEEANTILAEDEETSTQDDYTPEKNPINILAGVLKDSGVISVSDEDLTQHLDEDYLTNQIKSEIEKGKDEFIEGIENKDYKDVVTLINKGVPINQAFEAVVKTAQYSNLNFDEFDEEDHKILIRDEMLSNDPETSEEDITEAIETFELANNLSKMAKKSFEKLQRNEIKQREVLKKQVDIQNQEKLKQIQEHKENFEKKIKEAKEIIPGIPINDGVRKIILDSEFKKDKEGKSKFNKIIESKPELLDQIKYFVNVLEGDWAKLNNGLKTKAVKDLKSKLDNPVQNKSKLSTIDTRAIERYLNRK